MTTLATPAGSVGSVGRSDGGVPFAGRPAGAGVSALRRGLGVAVLVAQPVVLLTGQVLRPADNPSDPAAWLDSVAAQPIRWYAAQLLMAVGALLLVPALVVLCRLIRERGGIFATTGAILAGVGATMAGVAFAGEASLLTVAARPELDRPALATFLGTLLHDPKAQLPYAFPPLLVLGLLLVTIGLYRARTLPRWLPIAWLLAFVLSFAGAPTPLLTALLGIPFVVTSALLGIRSTRTA